MWWKGTPRVRYKVFCYDVMKEVISESGFVCLDRLDY